MASAKVGSPNTAECHNSWPGRVSSHDHRPPSFPFWTPAFGGARSGRHAAPAYVVVALPDGRRRSVRIASTNLAEAPTMPGPDIPSLPRISVRTLIPLMQHLSANLSLLAEKVIRDGPPTPSRSRCVSTAADFGKPTRPSGGRLPRLWPNLSTETQTQIARILAELIRRVQAIPDTPGREMGRADRLERR